MANSEHFKLIKQGVEVWNRWRRDHHDKRPDLSEANLGGEDLTEVNFRWANLKGADLTEANLGWADLGRSDLRGVHLMEANLGGADLRKADLTNAHIRGADLGWADLREAQLRWVDFRGADLRGADLRKADLGRADLSRADFSEADLGGADLQKANLSGADLSRTNLREANITGATLWGTTRNDWIIDRIICEYVYWVPEGNQRTPVDRNFRLGEFEALYKHLPTVEYYFEHGFTSLDAVIIDRVVQAINEQHPEFELKLTALDSRGQPHAVFTVIHQEHVDVVRKEIRDGYEARITALEGQMQEVMQALIILTEQPKMLINNLSAARGELSG